MKLIKKLKNYIDLPIWFLGYASGIYNFCLIGPNFEDGIEKNIAKYISSKIENRNQVDKIFLAQFSNKNYLLEIP